MPITFEFKDSILRIRFFGVISNKDLMEIQAAMSEQESRQPVTPHRISDLSEVTEMQIDFGDILSLASVRRTKQFPNSFKSAIVAVNEAQTGFARMFQTLNSNSQITIRIFHDAQSALAWVSPAAGE